MEWLSRREVSLLHKNLRQRAREAKELEYIEELKQRTSEKSGQDA
jgi:hypothetical protein